MQIERLDHLEPIEVEGRHALPYGFEPKTARPMPGSADLCFITSQHRADIAGSLETTGSAIKEGPVPRNALGPMHSLSICDPDRNLIEIAVYEPATATEEAN